MMAMAIGTGVVEQGAAAAEATPGGFQVSRFLGEQSLPHKMEFAGTVVGGLSGLDRDPHTGNWYFISDDRGRYNSPRFYTGRLDINRMTGAFTGVRLTGATTLRRPDGSAYPSYGQPHSADPETIRFDRWSRRLLWGHEGDRPDAANTAIPVSSPFVRWMDQQGRHLGELPMPGNLAMATGSKGPRRNSGIEGLTFSPGTIAAIVEGPQFEDGKVPTVRKGAPSRITVWSRSGRLRAQYAYPLDRVPQAPVPATGHSDTGVSEILAIDDHRHLALERAWMEGVGYKVKLYEIDLRGATNVMSRRSLATGTPYRPVRKRLVLDLGTVRTPVQNLEGIAWGPRLASGECTVVIGSDDNFDSGETTQFLAFAARGC